MQLRIAPKQIHFLKFILEGYDNLATLSTVDCGQGLVVIRYLAGQEDDLIALLGALGPSLRPDKH